MARLPDKAIASVPLLGSNKQIAWTQDQDGLHVSVPGAAPSVGA
jgi:hypothetical protein